MTIAWPKIVVVEDVPDQFYSYMVVNYVFYVSLMIGSDSIATISCVDEKGNKEEVYRQEFIEPPGYCSINDIGAIVAPYVSQGKYDFTLNIEASNLRAERKFRAEYMVPRLVLKEEFPVFTFSSALDHITFFMQGTRQSYSVQFNLYHGAEIILSEIYVPDVNNEITIRDLSSLVNPDLQEKLLGDFQIEIKVLNVEDSGVIASSNIYFTALYCRADVDMTAEDFIGNFFLSTLMGAKVTAPGQKEYLHFVTTDEDFVSGDENKLVPVRVYADYVNSEMKKTSNVFEWNVPINAAEMQIMTVDVSPLNFVEKGMTLVAYKVVVGSRTQMFSVSQRFDSEPDIAFKNSFGLFETLYFTGTKEDAPELSRSAAYVNGEYRNYHVEENRIVKANTGVIPETMVCLVDELARSTEAYLIEKGEIGRQITVTESELKRTNELDALFNFQITYRLAKRNQNILKVDRPVRTFDSTFDKTFE